MLTIEPHDDVAVLRMENGKVNELDAEFLEEMADALEKLQTSEFRAFVLTGRGGIFSAGADLRRVLREGEEYATRGVRALSRAFLTLFEFPRPMVAAVNGHAIAGGCVIACACDQRLMARGTGTIGLAELRVGVPFPTAALEIVRSAIAARSIQEVVYLGDNYPPEEALNRGLIDRIVEPNELESESVALARRLGAIPPTTFSITKRALRRDTIERIERHAPAADPEVQAAWGSAEVRGAMERFLESLGIAPRRSPRGPASS